MSNIKYRLIAERTVEDFNAAVGQALDEGFQMHEAAMVLLPIGADTFYSMQMIKAPVAGEVEGKNGEIIRH